MLNTERLAEIWNETRTPNNDKALYLSVEPENMLEVSNELIEADWQWCGGKNKPNDRHIIDAVNKFKTNPYSGFVFYALNKYYYHDNSRNPKKNTDYIAIDRDEVFEGKQQSIDFNDIFSLINSSEGVKMNV